MNTRHLKTAKFNDLGVNLNTLKIILCRIDSSVVGGESVLLDSYPIVEELRKNHPLQFDVLTKTQIRLKNRMVFDK